MKNDLIPFEKELLKSINFFNNTNYTHQHLMEWSSNKQTVEENLKEGEILYKALNCYIAIKPSTK